MQSLDLLKLHACQILLPHAQEREKIIIPTGQWSEVIFKTLHHMDKQENNQKSNVREFCSEHECNPQDKQHLVDI